MSKKTLDAFFESARPCRYDISLIVKAVVETVRGGTRIRLDTEHIWYDSCKKKVYMVKQDDVFSVERYREEILGFFRVLCAACEHAGDGTDMFMQELYALVRNGAYDVCIDVVARYILFYKEDVHKNTMVYILCAAVILISELVFLIVTKVRFY